MFRFPWGDMHSLNLGWFLQKFNELREDWATAEAGIDGALDAEIQRAEDALSDVFDARDAAAASATAAAGSASAAGTSATAAQNSATAAASSATLANNKATAAGLSEAAAAQSATQAGNSASAAATSATQAGNSATNAANSATAAGQSAAAAAASEQNVESIIEDAASEAVVSATQTATTAATNAANSATAAAGSATAAAGSATAAEASAQRAEAVPESIPPEYTTLSNYVQGATALTQYLLTAANSVTLVGRAVTLAKNKAHIKRTATGSGYIGISLFGNGAVAVGGMPAYNALASANAFAAPLDVQSDFAIAIDLALIHNPSTEFAFRGIQVIQDNNGTPVSTVLKNQFPSAGVTGPVFQSAIIPNSILTGGLPWSIVFGVAFGNTVGDEADIFVNLRPVITGASGLMSIRDNISLSDIEQPQNDTE